MPFAEADWLAENPISSRCVKRYWWTPIANRLSIQSRFHLSLSQLWRRIFFLCNTIKTEMATSLCGAGRNRAYEKGGKRGARIENVKKLARVIYCLVPLPIIAQKSSCPPTALNNISQRKEAKKKTDHQSVNIRITRRDAIRSPPTVPPTSDVILKKKNTHIYIEELSVMCT